jgi:hypothetical protein
VTQGSFPLVEATDDYRFGRWKAQTFDVLLALVKGKNLERQKTRMRNTKKISVSRLKF